MKLIDNLKYDERGLIPAIVQDLADNQVLMVAYMNREALEKTLTTGKAHFYSRTRKKLWEKGESSGNYQEVKKIMCDCDEDTLLLQVSPAGPACHTGEKSCFFRNLKSEKELAEPGVTAALVLESVYNVIMERKKNRSADSYVTKLMENGLDAVLAKVEEEAQEVLQAARREGRERLIEELADLWFHTLVLMGQQDIALGSVLGVLSKRFGKPGLGRP